MSGLLDEAVEAMARAIDGCRPRDTTWTAWTSVLARAALAALPAGFWHSDGQGKVVLAGDLERVIEGLVNAIHGLDSYAELGGAPMERTMRANGAVADARDVLAALSATDAESAT